MADQRLGTRGAASDVDDADLIHVVDVSDTTSDPTGTSKKLTWSVLKSVLITAFDLVYQAVGNYVTIDTVQQINADKGYNRSSVQIDALGDLSVVNKRYLNDKFITRGTNQDTGNTGNKTWEGQHIFNGKVNLNEDSKLIRTTEEIDTSTDTSLINKRYTEDKYKIAPQNVETYEYAARVVKDGGFAENLDSVNDARNRKGVESIQLTPSGFGVSTLYGIDNLDGTDGDFISVRALDTATRFNSKGIRETSLANITRVDYSNPIPHLLLEEESTNLYLNSDTLITQGITTLADDYTVSFEGTGTITFSGTFSGSLVGTGDTDRVSLTLTATAGTLTSTVSGTVVFAQAENLDYNTSYIPTDGTTKLRNSDTLTNAGSISTINSEEGVLFIDCAILTTEVSNRAISLSDGTSNNRLYIIYQTSINQLRGTYISGGVKQAEITANGVSVLDFNKIAFKWKLNDFSLWINGIEIGTDNSGSVLSANTLDELNFNTGTGGGVFYGKLRELKIFQTALSDSELAALTSKSDYTPKFLPKTTIDNYFDSPQTMPNINVGIEKATITTTYELNRLDFGVWDLTMSAATTFTDVNLVKGNFITIYMTGNFTPTFPSYWTLHPDADTYDGTLDNLITIDCRDATGSSEVVDVMIKNLT